MRAQALSPRMLHGVDVMRDSEEGIVNVDEEWSELEDY